MKFVVEKGIKGKYAIRVYNRYTELLIEHADIKTKAIARTAIRQVKRGDFSVDNNGFVFFAREGEEFGII